MAREFAVCLEPCPRKKNQRTADGCGFAFGSKQWNSKQHPNLTLADAGGRYVIGGILGNMLC